MHLQTPCFRYVKAGAESLLGKHFTFESGVINGRKVRVTNKVNERSESQGGKPTSQGRLKIFAWAGTLGLLDLCCHAVWPMRSFRIYDWIVHVRHRHQAREAEAGFGPWINVLVFQLT